jgi:hypothetical protein
MKTRILEKNNVENELEDTSNLSGEKGEIFETCIL